MEKTSSVQQQNDIELSLSWLRSNGYLTEKLYKNAVRYYKDEKNIFKLQNKTFENWVYDEYLQKTIIDENYFNEMKLKESMKVIAIFGELYSGREYTMKHLYNAGRILDRKLSYIKESLRGILCKKLSDFTQKKEKEKEIGMMIRCFPLNEYYVDEAQNCKKLQKERFINQFIADIANVIIYINNDEDDKTNENLKQFKEKYNISNQRQVIVIKNGFKKENFDIETIETEEKLNKYRIYYENEDQNIGTFKRIFQKIKEIKKGTKQNIDVRYKDYFTINQSFLNGDWIKCEYPELNKSTCLVSKNNTNTLTVTFEFYEQLSNVTHQSIIWNNSLYLIITAESIAQSTTNYYTFIHNTNKPLDKERKDFMQDKETGLVTITLYYK